MAYGEVPTSRLYIINSLSGILIHTIIHQAASAPRTDLHFGGVVSKDSRDNGMRNAILGSPKRISFRLHVESELQMSYFMLDPLNVDHLHVKDKLLMNIPHI